MKFEWHPEKAKINLRKHEISFEEAQTVFGDFSAIMFFDPAHSDNEDRYITIGYSTKGNILFIAHTYRGDDVRIISARKATRKEKRYYERRRNR